MIRCIYEGATIMMQLKERTRLITIHVDRIYANPSQPRRVFDEEELDKLAESIRENGLLQPITVRKQDKHYIIIAGERRFRACKRLGMLEIPAILVSYTQERSAVMAIIENLQRQDLNMFEEANAIVNLLREWDITQEKAAKKLGMSQSHLANKIRLLKLEHDEQDEILNNGLTERHARALLKIPNINVRQKVLSTVIDKHLNVSQTEDVIEDILKEREKRKAPMRTFIAKDIRLFINTINHAVDTMKIAGIAAKTQRMETDDYIECTVRIPKK